MSKLEEFKSYVKRYPKLINYVKEGKYSWQSFYELYDIYGEDNDIWNKYISDNNIDTSNNSKEEINSNKITSVSDVVRMVKNMDVNKVQDGISSLQKAVDLFSTIFIKDGNKGSGSSYTPRPIYRRFDD